MSYFIDWLLSLLSGGSKTTTDIPEASVIQSIPEQAAQVQEQPVPAPAIQSPIQSVGVSGHRYINQAGIDLIKSFEGLRLNSYQDSVGVWTIGFGHTHKVTAGMSIDEATAEQFLKTDLYMAESAVENNAPGLNDNKFAALCSFCFNLGEGPLFQLLQHGIDNVAEQIPRWDHAGGQVLAGLTKRRLAEVELWNTA